MSTPAESPDRFEISTDRDRIDRDVAWRFLSTEAYWGRWRAREHFETQVANAWRLGGAYERATGAMVGFARAISDGVSFAYLGDVFVLPSARGHGVGVRLVREMVERPPGDTLRWALKTLDAQGLYTRFGFAPPEEGWLIRPGTHERPG